MCKDPNTGEKRHVAWAKIIATLNHLKKNDCDYVIYIDTDAFLLNQIHILDYLNNINCDNSFRIRTKSKSEFIWKNKDLIMIAGLVAFIII